MQTVIGDLGVYPDHTELWVEDTAFVISTQDLGCIHLIKLDHVSFEKYK